MKSAEDYLEEKRNFDAPNQNFHYVNFRDAVKILEQAQIDAYNEAIDDAIKHAKIKDSEYINPYSESDGQKTYSVDKDSLLKLKKKELKKVYKPGFYQFNI